jgi:hypothetical protein
MEVSGTFIVTDAERIAPLPIVGLMTDFNYTKTWTRKITRALFRDRTTAIP